MKSNERELIIKLIKLFKEIKSQIEAVLTDGYLQSQYQGGA